MRSKWGFRDEDAGMRIAVVLAAALVGGCGGVGDRLAGDDAPAAEAAPETTATGDVLAPEVFSFAGEGLWDGRPSLGGVWVAHPDVEVPGRVLIRLSEAGVEVTGALFRRQGEAAGPPMQVSSDAASALGLIAGQPAALEVTALRPPEAPEAAPAEEPFSLAEETAAVSRGPVLGRR